jgi:hypothetical protein
MAKYLIDSETLTSIANATRNKTGKEVLFTTEEIKREINKLTCANN